MTDATLARPLREEVMRLLNAGQHDAASARLDAARRDDPKSPEPSTIFGEVLVGVGRSVEALPVFEQALALDPAYPHALYGRGRARQGTGDLDGAKADFAKTLERAPDHVGALAQLADLAARAGDSVVARDYAARAHAGDPHEPVSNLALVSADLVDGQFFDAEQRARRLLASGRLSAHNAAIVLGQLGDALDGQIRQDEAFDAYTQSNEGLRTVYAKAFARPEEHSPLGHARRLIRYFENTPEALWTAASEGSPGPARMHVFLVGFPRSGTTLLEQVLASHPDVTALEEKTCLEDAVRAFFIDDAGLERLKVATDAELEPLRAAYWKRVAEHGVEPQGRVFVDKMPLNTVLLPLIVRLFPDARVLFAVRDPRDVALSCFRRRFGMNPAMYQMLTLKGAAEYYDAVLTLATLYHDRLPLDVHEVRYERLVESFEAEARAAAAFIGIDWIEGMADFADTARARAVNTPSSQQVARGLYQEGAGQWRAYADKLAPVMPILGPWVDRLGYAP